MTATVTVNKDGKGVIEGREIRSTRVVDAPRELVWTVWTEPQHVTNWWGPRGFTTTSKSMDVRVGGEWQLVMHGPDGRDYQNRVVYEEVVKPERLAYRHMGDEASERPIRFRSEVTFEDLGGGKTRVTMCGTFDSVEDLEYVVKNYHADKGSAETMSRMVEYVTLHKARTTGATPSEGELEREIVLTRVFNAGRELVWAAWTEPEHMMQWWGPRSYSCPKAEIELRPGGKMLMVMRGPDRMDMPCAGEVVEVKAPERLVFRTFVDGPDGQRLLEGHNTVTLTEQDGKTTMVLVARAKVFAKAAIPMLAGMEMGWTQSLEKMEASLKQ